MNDMSNMEAEVQKYYGKELKSSEDLKTNVCCTVVEYPDSIKSGLANIHDEVITKYYGCGLTIPSQIQGLDVLDLGSGTGRDCYLLSQLVGESGSVTGIDMTDEQLEVANKHLDWHRERFGYARSNVNFVKGNIQDLSAAGIESDNYDVVVSNCVVNLATDKRAVLADAYRVLREGGEFYFSDVYCDRRLPKHLVEDRELYGECLGGALYWNDFVNLAKSCGFKDPRIVECHEISIENISVAKKVEGYKFYSVTYRLFKIPELEAACEDYGQAVEYLGGIEEQELKFVLDNHHTFEKGRVVPVCGNSLLMLQSTRYERFFNYYGDFSTHFGIFPGCGSEFPYHEQVDITTSQPDNSNGSCC